LRTRASRQDLLASGMAEEKVEALSRKELRSYVADHKRVGRRTGTTPHFEAWKAEGQLKSILQKTKTAAIADSLPSAEHNAASGFALLSVGGFKNVWDVSQASTADLLAVRGIGIVRLGFIEDYLKARGVALAWSAND
jgi:hypothetical protein